MQEVIAPVSSIRFDIEIAIEQQIGSLPLPFPGMDSKISRLNQFCFGVYLHVLFVLCDCGQLSGSVVHIQLLIITL